MKRLALVLLLLPALTWAQTCHVIRGVVTDSETDIPLPGANIRSRVYASGGSTDHEGKFEVPYHDNDTLVITYIGYYEQILLVSHIPDCTIRIILKPSTNEIKEVEITTEKIIAEEFTLRKIRKLEIYTNPAAKADPILAVNSLPSATTTDESANISLRGGSPAETGIFFNNVPINDAVRYSQLNGIGTFSIFNTALINNVQVYPGNPPLEYGNSTSGLIALQTDENIPARSQNSLSLTLASLGLFSTRKISSNASITFFSNYQPSALIRALNHESLKNLKSFSSADAGIHYFQKIGKRAVVKVFNYTLREAYEFRYEQPSYDGIFHQHKTRNFTVANFRKRIGDKTELTFNQGVSYSKATYQYGTTDLALKLNDLFSSVNVHRVASFSEWKTGISYDRKQSDFVGSFPTFEYAAGENHPVSNASSNNRITNPEWFGYYKQFFGTKWIAGAGARKNIPVSGNKNYFSYQSNIHFRPQDKLTFNLSAGRYFKYHLPQGESDASSLTTTNQLSFDMTVLHGTDESSISVFYKEGTRSSIYSTIKGIEIFNKYRINRNLRFQLSLTSLYATESVQGNETPSPYNIHYFVRGNIEYKLKGVWTFTTVFLLRQGSYHHPVTAALYNYDLQVYIPEYSNEPERLPGYNTVDFSLSRIFPLGEKVIAIGFLSAGNIFNIENVRTYSYNYDYTVQRKDLFSQRTIYFGVILNF